MHLSLTLRINSSHFDHLFIRQHIYRMVKANSVRFLNPSIVQHLDTPWSKMSSILSRLFLPRMFSRVRFSNPIAGKFVIECCYLGLSCLSCVNLCKRRSPTNRHEYALGGTRTHYADRQISLRIDACMHSGGPELTK